MQLLRLNAGERHYGESPFPGQVRHHWEFQAILSGRARTTPDDREPGCTSPKLYISGPQSTHGWTDDRGGRSEIAVMHFTRVPEAFHKWVPLDGGLCLPLGPESLRVLTFARTHLEPHYRRPRTSTEAAVRGVLYLFLEIVLAAQASGEPPASRRDRYHQEKIRQALHYYEQNLWRDPSVDAVATAIGLSASQMRRIFRSALGLSPHEALSQRRMERATNLLRSGESVTSVAHTLGFSEISAFSRAYTLWAGQPPGSQKPALRSTT
ncbi:MAG: helix-turn-helix transcriptional regulator [Opitutales bacterium]|nr:helix-turn-helix transcriptional regulator [Opitutales bacterium]